MTTSENKLLSISAKGLRWLGIFLLFLYLIYLLFPRLFESDSFRNVGLIYYCRATAGAAFIPWGILLGQLHDDGIKRTQVLQATALGFALLGVMRLGTFIFPHAPFDTIRFIPLIEFLAFSALAFKIYKS